jgi:CheY-like chemotaxis protein
MMQKRTILLVDDHIVLLRATQDVLEMSGYQVLSATNGRDALLLFEQHQASLGLVITDLDMPDMDGVALMTALRAKNPQLKILMMSGNLEMIENANHPIHQADLVLPKPFRLPHLLAAIRGLLPD